ncbi:hypothetical protein GE061_004070 [Apolygus lucorum]|uniref:G-protein coupled receptors family 1 profile domain-containing protein n=1 Tax=Apolygus lucorum TaxID=248454 RepID=A0A8S9X0T7_APOLU|nr:hypothetical protein GE061_004070 [Apolygus lucorum]
MVLIALAVCDSLVILTSIWFEVGEDYYLLNAYNGLPKFDHYSVIYLHNYYIQCSFFLSRVIYKMAATSSLYLTVIITLERYVCICRPFWFEEWCSYSRICKSVAATIVFSIAYHMSRFWEYSLVEHIFVHKGKIISFYVTLTSEPATDFYYKLDAWLFIFLDYLIPLSSIVVLNTITFIKLRKLNTKRREISIEQRSENKLTAMMLYSALLLMWQLRETFNTLNSSVNIITYLSSWLPFRRSFMKMFCCETASARNPDQAIDLQDRRP